MFANKIREEIKEELNKELKVIKDELTEDLKEVKKSNTRLQDLVTDLEDKLRKTKDELEEVKVAINNSNEIKKSIDDHKNSQEPWVDIVSEEFDKEHGVKLKLDWNDAFITYLKKEGITAPSEDEMVQVWLSALSREW